MTSETNLEGDQQLKGEGGDDLSKSALQDNIERKGNQGYYYAHAHKANGPKWDGKAEPRLLSSSKGGGAAESDDANNNDHVMKRSNATFDYNKSNITSYAFLDEPSKVKIYIEMKDVGTLCTDDDIELKWAERSFSLTVNNYKKIAPESAATAAVVAAPCLCFTRLSGAISDASSKRKDHKIILTLFKVNEDVTWHTINDKGSPDHEVV
mmetsp:Transcript_9134/g.12135  ORF Transcript_9134/g.12135 Transcript_9134/m.12135 type:complete len:209 (-) Transcript_9134:133-759(-)|eukprot:CAMPEP_0198143340 /NCGR_PEP_ID=MMETSP1443-20131203/6560_1 /TAXON_ID=186043 /ORGANISM="Entomoneis sp., Strain CCMP2396" /LENGTH=208 /DNA_ID=CAMNT_0043806563 /DNA_START=85 /DNA_END=711 /DNA_ORIENTATION=-